jgi:hypothetical protein
MAVPMAWILAQATTSGFRPWEKAILFAAFLLPLLSRPLAMRLGAPVAPLVLGALYVVTLRRTPAFAGTRAQ